MLPLIIRASDGKDEIFMPSHPEKKVRGLLCFKNFKQVGAAPETMYCFECKGKNPLKTVEVEALEDRQRQCSLPFLLECTNEEHLLIMLNRSLMRTTDALHHQTINVE